MDNIAHTLAGLALLRTGLGRKTRFAGAALVLGSNLPDADLVALARGRLAFIDAHRGISHSLVGGCVLGVLLGAGLWALGRMWQPRDTDGAPARGAEPAVKPGQARFGPLCGLALLAVLLHLAFDSLNDYGIRLLLPFMERWYYGDIIFVVDPWFWLLLGGGAHLAMRRGGVPEALVWAGWAILSIPVLFDASPPMPVKILWLLGLLALGTLRMKTRPEDSRWPRAAFGALAIYVLAVAALHAGAVRKARAATQEREPQPVSRLALIPRPADPLHWNLLYETPEAIVARTAAVGSQEPPHTSERRYLKHRDEPRVQRALATAEGQVARRFSR